nr:MAG TPA: Protein of unknown function (DUF3568) [Caudoviricetes sp.]
MKHIVIATIAAISLSGCALISDPIPMGDGVYTLHATGGTYSSQAGMRDELWAEATEFCAKQGKTPILLDQGSSAGHTSYHAPSGAYTGGGFAGGFASSFGGISSVTYPEADIVFRCMNPEQQKVPDANGKRVSSWVTTAVHPIAGVQAIDITSIRTEGQLKTVTTCIAADQNGTRNILVSTSDVDCSRWEYRSHDLRFYINETAVEPPASLVEELAKWTRPKDGAPAQKLLNLVCNGPTERDFQTGVKESDPIRYANTVLDFLRNTTTK